ncbi:(3S,6E)-nerolidol synthase 1-like [Cynara cardunculus var. scolymus]|uniref:Terpene synthase, metal-binding domain-containing protein n=1 Tax=Cynara cardunculus var. scolymus TaxID=59895 RepID=A0A103XSY3_CYNCS|nr:(3S,6E)-nerolidol synthase 1-like [Cynara cardunculus var. scolymus]KVH96283.1 Terpene synthase, metal-binding domain-containing protein [Cynara cardunculus var. scolymus]
MYPPPSLPISCSAYGDQQPYDTKRHQSSSISSKEDFMPTDINDKQELSIKHSKHLEEVRNLLKEEPFQTLDMVDCLQKLCIGHHFQDEIDSILKMSYTRISNGGVDKNDQSLFEVARCFRILRQEGYYVPSDVFSFIKQDDGRFKEEIAQDVKGLVALYEASQLSIGECIFEGAVEFCSDRLTGMMGFLVQDETLMVKTTLEHPYQRTSSSFLVKKFIKHYAGSAMSQLAELELAKVQSAHQTEVEKISRWWKDLGLAQELKLARNQPLNWYLWPMASLIDPNLSEERVELTKPIALIFIIDDIYDLYGTLDELIVFTEAVKRWDTNSLDQLPYHQRICIQALYDVTHEISDRIYKKHGFNPIAYFKNTWITLCEAFLVEARWFASGNLPMAADYLKNGIVSSGAQVVIVHMFFLLGGGTSKETASVINDNQVIPTSLAKILRLWDDLGCAKDENQDGHDGSYVMYYMKENEGCSIQNAREHVMSMISDTWKQLNKECLFQNQFSATFTKACVNLARMVPIMYNYDENHSLPLLKEYINSMF